MKKILLVALVVILNSRVAYADGIAPLAGMLLDIPILILLLPIALIEGIYLYKKLKCANFLKFLSISFLANFITTLIGCIFVPVFAFVDIIATISIDGCLDGCHGWEELGLPAALCLQWIFILLPAIFLFWISYILEYKFINSKFRKKDINIDTSKTKKAVFNANVITYILVTALLLFFETRSIVNWPNWKETPACTIERPLRGLEWERIAPPSSIIERRGNCFDCDYADDIIITTKQECDKCPNRYYTGEACILKECPPGKPIKNGKYREEEGYYCESCDSPLLSPINKDEPCQKCPNYTFDEEGKCDLLQNYHSKH